MKTTKRRQKPELGAFIQTVIASTEYTREKWAEMLDISPRMLCYCCKGERRLDDYKLLRMLKIAHFNTENIPF